MRKNIIIILIVSLVVILSAQQGQGAQPGQSAQPGQQIKHKKTITTRAEKRNYEQEYKDLNDDYKKLQSREKETRMKWMDLDKKHRALVQGSNTYQKQNEALTKANNMLQNQRDEYKSKFELKNREHNELRKRYRLQEEENGELIKENIRLKAELDKLTGTKKVKKLHKSE
ncbi:MAG: hypothetical protein K9N07_09140 [Candidatus Cloacimonetes bacterium]|nr:hypothetical protein [Candidatus Cloacimonadota bacterium]